MITKKQPNLHPENLKPFNTRSVAEARENGKKGGIASGKARRLKSSLRELVQQIGDFDAPEQVNQILKDKFGIDCDLSLNAAAVLAQYAKALNGDTAAYKALRDSDDTDKENKLQINLVVSGETKEILERAKREGID